MVHMKVQLGLQIALPQHTHTIKRLGHNTSSNQRGQINRLLGIQLASIDSGLQAGQVDLVEGQPVRLGETALRQAAIDWHLTTFEAQLRTTRTRAMALVTAASRLALAGTNASANTRTLLAGTLVVGDFVELHRSCSLAASGYMRLTARMPW